MRKDHAFDELWEQAGERGEQLRPELVAGLPEGARRYLEHAITPASARSVPIVMVAVFCATLGVVLVIAVIDMLSPGPASTAGERAPSWPAR